MSVHKQTVSFTEAAFAFAHDLVKQGDYPNVSAAVSGELAVARRVRETEKALLEVELERRLQLPPDQWIRVDSAEQFTAGARAYLAGLDLPE